VKKSHVRKFSGEASREKISREKFFWEGLPWKNLTWEIFLRRLRAWKGSRRPERRLLVCWRKRSLGPLRARVYI